MKHVKILLLILFFVFFFKETFSEEEIIYNYKQLKGLKELVVSALVSGDDLGITSDSLRYYAEGRLREAGIEILGTGIENDYPFITLSLTIKNGVHSFSFDVFDKVLLARDQSIHFHASIWQRQFTSNFNGFPKIIMDMISHIFDEFLKAHRKANLEK